MNAKNVNTAKHIVIQIACLFLVFIMVAGDVAASTYYTLISSTLGQRVTKVEEADGSQNVDTEYYKSEVDYDIQKLKQIQADFARQIQQEGTVVLKNVNLPLAETGSITLLGGGSAENAEHGFLYGGGGSGAISTSDSLNLKEIFESAGYAVNPVMWDYYNTGAGMSNRNMASGVVGEKPIANMSATELNSITQYQDVGVVVISRPGAEATDLPFATAEDPNKHYLELSQNEIDLVNFACENFNNVVVLLNTMQAIELDPILDKNLSILWIGGAGQQGATILPDVLNGKAAPSGRLVDTFASDLLSAPSTVNQGSFMWTSADGSTQNPYYVYAESIYVGYRYYETRYADAVTGRANAGNFDYTKEVSFPFGYGLSYTSFAYSDFAMTEKDDTVTVSVKVTNTGDSAGKEVVQVYMQAPYTDFDIANRIEKEAVALVGFDKTAELAPGASETVTIDIPKEYMKAYDAYVNKTYIVEAGDYYFAVGSNAHDALNNILAAQDLTDEQKARMDAQGDASFCAKVTQKDTDTTTYAVTSTGTTITNQLDDVDINYYDSDFVYLSRNDWVGTYPTPYGGAGKTMTATDAMFAAHAVPDPQPDPDAQMPTTGASNGLTLASMIGLDYDDPLWEDLLDELTYDEMAALIRGSFGNQAVSSIQKPFMLDSDGPAGITASLAGQATGFGYPVEVLVASTWNLDITERMGELVGEDSLMTLASGWYAPGVNIHRSSFSGRNFEYYSEDPLLSGEMAGTVIRGAAKKGAYCYMKHFAINDQETNRVRGNNFCNEQAARQLYLRPFEIPIREYDANAMMIAMNAVGMTWIGHHRGILQNIVRDEWGFNGAILTDTSGRFDTSINDTAIWAGVDMFLGNRDIDPADFASAGMMQELREAAHHTLYMTANSNGMNGFASNTKVVKVTPPWVIWLAIANAVVILGALIGSFFNIKRMLRNRKMKG